MDPQDPNTLFAGMWQVEIRPWGIGDGGLGSGVYVTHDAGATWTKLTGNGLPPADRPLGKVAVQVAPSDPNRVYVLTEEDTPRFYRSDDGGKTWTLGYQGHIINERAPYYTRFGVDPKNENKIIFVAVSYSVSLDGGRTLKPIKPGEIAGGDMHDVWYDPLNPQRILIADDAGGSISLNGGETWQRVIVPIGGMYDVRVDNNVPYNLMGNRQDGPSFWAPSDNLGPGGGQLLRSADYCTAIGN